MNSLEYTAISNLASSIRIVVDKNAGLPRTIFINITLASPHLVFSGKITVTSIKYYRSDMFLIGKTSNPSVYPSSKSAGNKTSRPLSLFIPAHPSL